MMEWHSTSRRLALDVVMLWFGQAFGVPEGLAEQEGPGSPALGVTAKH